MAVKWLDPGGSATGGVQLLDSPTAGVTAQTGTNNGQAYAYKFDTGGTPSNQSGRKNAMLQAAGNRISVYFRVPVLPAIDNSVSVIAANPTGSSTPLLSVRLGSDGKLRLYTNSGTTLLGVAGATALSVNTWYRVTLSYAITTTTNWSAKVYIDGALEMTRTNADGTLSSAAPTDLFFGVPLGAGTNWILYLSDIYVDDTTTQTDPGDVHVSRRAVTTVSSGSWDTTTGTGSLIERPVDTANRIGQLATSAATVDYNVEADSAGDADLTGATMVGRSVFAWYTLSSLTGTPTGKLRMDGTAIGAVMDPAVAGTYQIHVAVDTTTTYPSTVGCTSSGLAADTLLAELGAIVAYTPSTSNNYTSNEAGNQPANTGVLARIYQALRALAGSQPTATGVLARIKQGLRSLAGSQPAPTGTLTRVLQAVRALAGSQPTATGALTASKLSLRSLAGSQPTATGALTAQKITARSLAGDQPAPTGALTRGIHATTRALAGDQPNATGVLTRGVHATTRALTGNQPAATGALTGVKATFRSLAGDQPAPTGTLTRIKQALRSLTGSQPNSTGALTASILAGARRAIVSWLELEAPFAIRTLTGNQPSNSGTLSRIKQAIRSLTGSQPAPTGVLTSLAVKVRSLAGSQPTATGALSRLLTTTRALAGNQPTATGALTRKLQALRAMAGAQPNSTGALSRIKQALRSLAGSQPNASGTLSAQKITARSLAGNQPSSTGVLTKLVLRVRALAGNQPTPTGTLSRRAATTKALTGDQPSPSGTLATQASYHRTLAGNQPAPSSVLSRQVARSRILAGNQPAPAGTLSVFIGAPTVRGFVFGSVRLVRGVSGREYALLRSGGELVPIGGTVTGEVE